MRIGMATDHGGFGLKEELAAHLREAGHEVVGFAPLHSSLCPALCARYWRRPMAERFWRRDWADSLTAHPAATALREAWMHPFGHFFAPETIADIDRQATRS